jgi:malic enzyme
MERYVTNKGADGSPRVEVPAHYYGARLLRHPLYNKGTAFTDKERASFGLTGLLPASVSSMEQQAKRVYHNILRKGDPLERYVGLAALQDRNEHLFYRVLIDHLEEFLPIVYTPTVGKACQEFSHIFRRGRGIWITPDQRGQMEEALGNAPFEDVRLIVVTDNERILGLGDQGAGGMGIPIGKLALYTAAAGIPPWRTLPVSLDVGTDNRTRLDDELYLGWRHERLRGDEYDSFIDEFVQAVKHRFPKALLQWEDFKKVNAFRLLERYRWSLPSFNDDIQGTAAVALAGTLAAGRATGTPLARQRIVILGAGAAGIGIARLLHQALRAAGLSGADLSRAVAVLDSRGLLLGDVEIREAHKREFAWPVKLAAAYGLTEGPRDLEQVVKAVQPTVLIGVSGEPGVFTEKIVRTMAAAVDRPAIFPLSNPTNQSEATPWDLLQWTGGRALVATGSPFEPVRIGGRTIRIGQANNSFVFPAMGLACLVAEVREVTDGMFAAAGRRLAEEVSDQEVVAGSLFPRVGDLRRVTARVAEAVVQAAREEGVGRSLEYRAIPATVAAFMWEPEYPALVAAAARSRVEETVGVGV